MRRPTVTDEAFRSHASQLLSRAGFEARELSLVEDIQPVVIAENPYYLIAFQIFDAWDQLLASTPSIELALWRLLEASPETHKTWDAYLVLACRGELTLSDEYNQLSNLVYDTRRTRKIVRVNVGDRLTEIDDAVRPFTALEQARVAARDRDPLSLLAQRLEASGFESALIRRVVTTFMETGHIIDG